METVLKEWQMQILNQFPGVLQPDLVDLQRYAAWKAADIRKAIREGRTPTPGPPDSDQPVNRFVSGLYLSLVTSTMMHVPYVSSQCKQCQQMTY